MSSFFCFFDNLGHSLSGRVVFCIVCAQLLYPSGNFCRARPTSSRSFTNHVLDILNTTHAEPVKSSTCDDESIIGSESHR